MPTRRVKRIYPMQIALMVLLGHTRLAPARKAARRTAMLVKHLARAEPSRF
ncbi:MAG: hypothetical protein ACREHE_07275 [Rhizomicrobium sp.]